MTWCPLYSSHHNYVLSCLALCDNGGIICWALCIVLGVSYKHNISTAVGTVSASQDISCLLWNHVLSQIIQVHILTYHFGNTHFNNFHTSVPIYMKWASSFTFFLLKCVHFASRPCVLCTSSIPSSLVLLWRV
jgi:hypothetical protein